MPDSYKEKLQGLSFIGKPKKKKIIPAYAETNGRQVGYHTERGTPGTGVSSQVDATVTGGEAIINPKVIERLKANGK